MSATEKRRMDAYRDTVKRMEPDIARVTDAAFYASAAISLKRIADAAETQTRLLERMLHELQAGHK